MPAEKLFDIALQYKKTKLWKRLSDTALFAFRLSNGEIGYCSVMGDLGEHIALALYFGRDGLDSYRRIYKAQDSLSELQMHEIMFSQDCVQCSFENKEELSPLEIEEAQRYAKAHGIVYRGRKAFPQFKRYRPARYPWFLRDETDEQFLYEALSAALEVAERLGTTGKSKLGFSDGAPYRRKVPFLEKYGGGYRWGKIELPDEQKKIDPSPTVEDELLLAKLKGRKKKGMIWACEAVMLPSPVSDEAAGEDGMVKDPENAPIFPFMLLTADFKSGMVVPGEPVADYEKGAKELVTDLSRSMADLGVPSEIRVKDGRTETLLSKFVEQAGTKVVRYDDLPLFDEIEESITARFCGDQDEEGMENFLKMMMEMDDETFLSMPDPLRIQILELERQGDLPEPLSGRVRRLFG